MITYFTPQDKILEPSSKELEEIEQEDWDSYDESFEEDSLLFDWDGDALASAGFGTDEDYNGYNEEY